MNRQIEQIAFRNIQATVSTQRDLLQRIFPLCNSEDGLLAQAMLKYPLPLDNSTLKGLLTFYLTHIDDATAVAFIQRSLTGHIAADVAVEVGDPDSLWVLLCQSVDARALRSVVYRYVLGLGVRQVAKRLGYQHKSPLAEHFRQAAQVIGWENLPKVKQARVWQPHSLWRTRLEEQHPLSVVEMDRFRLLTLHEGQVAADEIQLVTPIDAEAFWRAVVEADYEPGLEVLVLRLGYHMDAQTILHTMGIRTKNQEDGRKPLPGNGAAVRVGHRGCWRTASASDGR
jgi:hypothetical protein